MPKTEIKIKTWTCPECDYSQDFEPTQENMDLHFQRVPENLCPACFMGKCPDGVCKSTLLPKETNPDKKTTITIMGEEDIEDEIMRDDEEKTKKGKVKMTGKEKADYRIKRKQDIQAAITKARLLEDI